MTESDLSGARVRISTVERRLAALQDLGLDVAALQTQLGQARSRIEQGQADDAQALCDEVAEAARRLASGASRSSGDWRGLPRAQLLEELRQALGDGALGEMMAEREKRLRDEYESRQRDFERRLRDQFARELAQVLSARPWMKDFGAMPMASEEISGLRRAVEAMKTAPPTITVDQIRQLIAEAQLSSVVSPSGSGGSMPGQAEIKRELESLRADLQAMPTPAQIRGWVVEAAAARGTARVGSGTIDDDLRRLVAEGIALQSRLGERLLGLEQQLSAKPADVASSPAPRAPSAPDPARPTVTAKTIAVPQPPTANPTTSPGVVSAMAPAVAVAVKKDADPPSDLVPAVTLVPSAAHPKRDGTGSEAAWPFPGDDSGLRRDVPDLSSEELRKQAVVPTAAMEPHEAPLIADDHGDGSRVGTLPSTAQPMQEPLTAALAQPARLVTAHPGVDENMVRKLIQESLAAHQGHDDLLPDDEEQGRQLVRLLPEVLRDPTVRSALFASLALEATAHPGALAELTGLRSFLRRELQIALDGLRRELGVGV